MISTVKIRMESILPTSRFIKIDPSKRFGKPIIRDTRIAVYDVLGWLASGMTLEDIIIDFPELTDPDIRGCLAYAADHERKLQVSL